jgi:molybdate transport system regulatory protein
MHSRNPSHLRPNLKVWIFSVENEGVFGDGKCRLLQAVDRYGSLRAACSRLKISYRKAWGDLRKAEACLGLQLMERHRGGKSGGGARLTPAGRRCVAAYMAFRKELQAAAEDGFRRHLANLSDGGGCASDQEPPH